MIPFDPVRNPFLQFNWLPCMNVGSANITPYSLAVITGVRCPYSDGQKSGPVTDDLNVVLEVVPLSALSTLTRFEPAQLVFTGPTTMSPATGGSYCAYGSCHMGDVGLLNTLYDQPYHFWPTSNLHPRLLLPLGSAKALSSLTSSTGLQIARIVRDMPIEVSYQDCAATTVGVTGSLLTFSSSTLWPDVSTALNWFFTTDTSSVTTKYAGWYEIGFGAKCETQYESGTQVRIELEVMAGTASTGIIASCEIIGDDVSGQTVYDYPSISARGIYQIQNGQEVGVVVKQAPTGRTVVFRDMYFYIRFHHGA